MAQAQAGQGQDLVAEGADPVLGLPRLAALDARPRMQHVMPPQTDQVVTASGAPGAGGPSHRRPFARPPRPNSAAGVKARSASRPPGRNTLYTVERKGRSQ